MTIIAGAALGACGFFSDHREHQPTRHDGMSKASRPARLTCHPIAIYRVTRQTAVERHLPRHPICMGSARHLSASKLWSHNTSRRTTSQSTKCDIVCGAGGTHSLPASLSPLHSARHCVDGPRPVDAVLHCCKSASKLCRLHAGSKWSPTHSCLASTSLRQTGTRGRALVLHKWRGWQVSVASTS